MMHSHKVQLSNRWLHSLWMLWIVTVAISFPDNNPIDPIVTTAVSEHSPVYAPRVDIPDDVEWDFISLDSPSGKCLCIETLRTGLNSKQRVIIRNDTTIRAPPEWDRPA